VTFRICLFRYRLSISTFEIDFRYQLSVLNGFCAKNHLSSYFLSFIQLFSIFIGVLPGLSVFQLPANTFAGTTPALQTGYSERLLHNGFCRTAFAERLLQNGFCRTAFA